MRLQLLFRTMWDFRTWLMRAMVADAQTTADVADRHHQEMARVRLHANLHWQVTLINKQQPAAIGHHTQTLVVLATTTQDRRQVPTAVTGSRSRIDFRVMSRCNELNQANRPVRVIRQSLVHGLLAVALLLILDIIGASHTCSGI